MSEALFQAPTISQEAAKGRSSSRRLTEGPWYVWGLPDSWPTVEERERERELEYVLQPRTEERRSTGIHHRSCMFQRFSACCNVSQGGLRQQRRATIPPAPVAPRPPEYLPLQMQILIDILVSYTSILEKASFSPTIYVARERFNLGKISSAHMYKVLNHCASSRSSTRGRWFMSLSSRCPVVLCAPAHGPLEAAIIMRL